MRAETETEEENEKGALDDGQRLTFKESWWIAVVLGLLIFARDWSGYEPREPDLFFPRPLRDVWWHLPVAVTFSFVALQLVRLFDWTKNRPWPYWVAYVVLLIAVVLFGVWVVLRIIS